MPQSAGFPALLFGTVAAVAAACAPVSPTSPEAELLQLEDARVVDVEPFFDALTTTDPRLQQLAARALGRFERPEHAGVVLALAGSGHVGVRLAAANALGQMRAPVDLSAWISREEDGRVRGAIFEAMGRSAPIDGVTEPRLVAGLVDESSDARSGAVHGLEAFLRLHGRTRQVSADTITALRRFVRENTAAELRELALLALTAARDRDEATLRVALTDPAPQVRRLAVMGLREWIDDPSPMVRYEALRLVPTCERAIAALGDTSGHVRLLAIDLLGTQPCPAETIAPLLTSDSWRDRAYAIVSLARVDQAATRRHLPAIASDPVWQARVYAARAARMVDDDAIRTALLADDAPNVVIAALARPADATAVLDTSHRGLLIAAAGLLEGAPDLATAQPRVLAAFVRLSREDRPTTRDARVALLARLDEARLGSDAAMALGRELRPWLADRDPVVAAQVAAVITKHTGEPVDPVTTVYRDDALPPAAFIDGLRGATARVTMRGLGSFTMDLLADEAPVTVAVFARHAERGGYDDTTFHRVVPNFVLQGGSPGAHEMDGAVGPYMRDELGLVRHLRGTLGISTRGRDTGDAQIFVNLVDNFRLDHQYTVFARVTDGMDVVDRILEGAEIEEIRILRVH
ncbi:MAG TPA: peptidylprolyl isomerase [Vicinamibacterales bacterium]|nr:peptidylprolyl isomerase [Vicinamibacterales bacterium]